MTRVTILFQGTKQNPPSSEDPQHVVVVVRFGAMVRKVTVTQTQARRTQQDSNTSALVCDVMTFLHMMTERCSSSNSNGGAVQLRTSTSLFLSATSLCLRCEKQVRQWIVSDNEIRLDHGCHECRSIAMTFTSGHCLLHLVQEKVHGQLAHQWCCLQCSAGLTWHLRNSSRLSWIDFHQQNGML